MSHLTFKVQTHVLVQSVATGQELRIDIHVHVVFVQVTRDLRALHNTIVEIVDQMQDLAAIDGNNLQREWSQFLGKASPVNCAMRLQSSCRMEETVYTIFIKP